MERKLVFIAQELEIAHQNYFQEKMQIVGTAIPSRGLQNLNKFPKILKDFLVFLGKPELH
jgi:hypothetical protein